MPRHTILSIAAFSLVVLAYNDAASAQAVAYRHRSTVFGDHAAGYSELVRAQGSFLRDQATAAETWVRVRGAHDQLMYQRAEHYYQIKQLELQYRRQKLDDKLARREIAQDGEEQAALRLWQDAQHGAAQWPVALQRREYASSMSLVESLLRGWSLEDGASGTLRKALATEIGVLRSRITANESIAYADRLQAIRTLKQLQLLATSNDASVVGGQLAMR